MLNKIKHLAFLSVCFIACTAGPKLPGSECGKNYSHMVNFNEVARKAEMVTLSYDSDSAIRARYEPMERVFIKTLPDIDTKYFIIYHDLENKQSIVIRGTDNLENIKMDAQYRKVFNERIGLWVHRGFNRGAEAIYKDIIKNQRLETRYTTTVVGHSLGGAIAHILFLDLMEGQDTQLDFLYTFGQPKAFTKKAGKKYRCINYMRFINEDDPVPFVPPTSAAVGLITSFVLRRHGKYMHFGDEIILLNDSNYVYLEYHDAERYDITSWWKHLGRKEVDFKDHKAYQYWNSAKRKMNVITEQQYKNRNQFK